MGKPSLIDRRTGQQTLLELPSDLTLDLLSVSPWLDHEGKPEAIARWANHATDDGSEPFCGLALLKLPETAIAGRIATDVLPTGRACFVPGRPGEILFPAGDGRLYRCTVRPDPAEGPSGDGAGSLSEGSRTSGGIRPVEWECDVPGTGNMLLSDPVWPSDPRLSHLLFVSFTSQELPGPGHFFEPARLWWLEVDDRGEAIRRAGPLDVSTPKPDVRQAAERYPTVVVSRQCGLGLVYLSQRARSIRNEVFWVPLRVDPRTGVPSAGPSQSLISGCADEIRLSPPIVAADGRSVLVAKRSGGLVRLEIPESGSTQALKY